jgi:hypothetical protein
MQYISSHSAPDSREAFNKLPTAEQVIFMQFGQEMETLARISHTFN